MIMFTLSLEQGFSPFIGLTLNSTLVIFLGFIS